MSGSSEGFVEANHLLLRPAELLPNRHRLTGRRGSQFGCERLGDRFPETLHRAGLCQHHAIKAVNDLGPGGETWTLASLSYAGGRLYAHTMKEIICIEESDE